MRLPQSSKVEGSPVNKDPAGDPLNQVRKGETKNDGGRDVGKDIPKGNFGAQPVAFTHSGLQVDVGLENPLARGKQAVSEAVDRNSGSVSSDNAGDQVRYSLCTKLVIFLPQANCISCRLDAIYATKLCCSHICGPGT